MDEFALIDHCFKRAIEHTALKVGVGDDAAVWAKDAETDWVISVDTMVAGIHFPLTAQAKDVGTRALCTAISDLAAMGAVPAFCTVAISLPDSNPAWCQAFSEGVWLMAERYGCPVIGGDTTRGPLTVTVTVQGEVPSNQALLRSGANAGDTVFVSGQVGDGGAALAHILGQWDASTLAATLHARFYQPEPQLALGQALRGIASSAMDVSDGVLADLEHLCRASNTEVLVALEDLPLGHWADCVTESQALEWAVSGDDYQLLFTVPEAKLAMVNQLPVSVTAIGRMQTRSLAGDQSSGRVTVTHRGLNETQAKGGYNHFRQ